MEKEININNFIEYVFNNQNPEPNSIVASFIDDTATSDLEGLFKILLTIFTEGMKKFYGKNVGDKIVVNLEELEEKDFKKINKYMNSFGINCKYSVNPSNTLVDQVINLKKENLSDYSFLIKCENHTYCIEFDYY